MAPDRQKDGKVDGGTDGHEENNIPPPEAGDAKADQGPYCSVLHTGLHENLNSRKMSYIRNLKQAINRSVVIFCSQKKE